MENDFNIFDQYLESQKKLMDMWSQMAQNYGQNFNNPLIQNPAEQYQKFFSQMMGSNPFQGYYGSPMEVVGKLGQGSEVYYNIYKLWTEIYSKNIEPNQENFEKLAEDVKAQSLNLLNSYVMPYLPENLQNTINESLNMNSTFVNTMQTVYGPWSESVIELSDAFMKGAFKDPEGFLEYFNKWRVNYDKTFNKFLQMPQMGIQRNEQAQILEATDKYIKFMVYFTQFMVRMNSILKSTTNEVIEKSFDRLKKGEQPKTFDEFYKFFKKTIGEKFDEIFLTGEFSTLLATFTNSLLDLKIATDKVVESQLKMLPIPVKSDMDSLYKTVYELKKEVRAMKKELAKLESESQKTKGTK